MKKVTLLVIVSILFLAYGTVLAAPPEAKSQPVTVMNTPSNPVPITGTVNIANGSLPQYVSGNVTCTIASGGENATCDLYTVPVGKRLIIEYASCETALGTDDHATCALVTPVDIGGGNFSITTHYLPTIANLVTKSGTHFSVGQQVKLFADSVSANALQVEVFIQTTSSSSHDVRVSFSGYLVDVP